MAGAMVPGPFPAGTRPGLEGKTSTIKRGPQLLRFFEIAPPTEHLHRVSVSVGVGGHAAYPDTTMTVKQVRDALGNGDTVYAAIPAGKVALVRKDTCEEPGLPHSKRSGRRPMPPPTTTWTIRPSVPHIARA